MTAVADRSQAGAVAATDRSWFPGWRPLAVPLAAWFASRAVSLAAIAVGNLLRGDGQLVSRALHRWDGNWYLEAAAGYNYPNLEVADLSQWDIAFFPLFPLLIRGLATVTGSTLPAAGIVVTAVFGALSLIAIWLLVNRISGRDLADRATILLAFFPGSIALTMVYAEGLMLTAVAACLLCLVDRRWLAAGVFGAIASAARPNGLAVAVACAVASLLAIHRSRDFRSLLAPLIAPLGAVVYFAWLWAATGSPGVWFRVQDEGWGEGIDFGAATMRDITEWYLRLPGEVDFLQVPWIVHHRAVGLILLVVLVAAMVRWRPPAILWAYAGAVMAVSLLSQTLGARPRFIFTAFPLVVALAWQVRGTAYAIVLACSGVLLAVATIVYTSPLVVAP